MDNEFDLLSDDLILDIMSEEKEELKVDTKEKSEGDLDNWEKFVDGETSSPSSGAAIEPDKDAKTVSLEVPNQNEVEVDSVVGPELVLDQNSPSEVHPDPDVSSDQGVEVEPKGDSSIADSASQIPNPDVTSDQGVEVEPGGADSVSKIANPNVSSDQGTTEPTGEAEGEIPLENIGHAPDVIVPISSRDSSVYSPLSTPGADIEDENYGNEDEEAYLEEGDEGAEMEAGKPKKKVGQNPLGENFMNFTWKKPDKELAAKRGKAGLWQGGERTIKDTSVHDFGDMSDGMELYFYVLRAFVGFFFVLTLLSVPLLTIATAGNRNMAIEDSTFPAAQSLGNTGYNPNANDAGAFCRDQEGDHSCVSMRYIFGLEVEARYVTFVISAYEALISVVMITFSIWLLMSVERTADQIDGEVSTPADFTVFVRNLPKDVSESALISHFSMRYALEYTQPRYPVMGYSVFGASLSIGFLAALGVGLVAGGSLTPLFGPLGSLAAPAVLLLLTFFFTLILWLCNFGAPKDRLTPTERWDLAEQERTEHREMMALAREKEKEKVRKYNEKHGKVVPEGLEDQALDTKPTKASCCKRKKNKANKELENIDMDGLGPDLPRPDPKPVANCLHNGFPPVLGSWVADLHMVYPNGSIISSYLKQKALMGKIQGMRSKIQQFKDDTPYEKGANPRKVEKFTKKLEKLQKKMEKVHAKVARKVKDTRRAADCEGCFITFHHEESRERCLDDYRASSSAIGRYFQPRSLQFMWNSEDSNTAEKEESWTSLRVEAAPEPSDIFWEKLHVTDTNRLVRVVTSNFVTFTVLLISFVIAVVAAARSKEANDAIASTNNCGHLPAIWYGKYYNETPGDIWDTTAVKWVRNTTKDATVCNGMGTYIVNEEFDLDPHHLPALRPPPDADSTTKINRPNYGYNDLETGVDGSLLCDDVCHYSINSAQVNSGKAYQNRTSCASLSCQLTDWATVGYPCFQGNLEYPKSTVSNCYCQQLFIENLGQLASGDPDFDLCTEFFGVYFDAQLYLMLSILSVIVVNGAALPIIEILVAFEKHVSVSAEKEALVSKMFSLQFMNTAVITLIVNTAYTGNTAQDELQMAKVGGGEYSNFNMDWYATVGSALCITMFTQIFSPHASALVKRYIANPLKRLLLSGSASTQDQLDELYEGQEFEIEARSAYIGVGLMVTMMYSAGMPVLTVFALMNFSLSWYIDKWLLIKEYAQPPMYGPAVPKILVNLLPVGTFIHIAFGLYMLANENILYGPDVTRGSEDQAESASSDSEVVSLLLPKLVRMHTLCLFFIFAAYSGLFVLYWFGLLDKFILEVGVFLDKIYAMFCGSGTAKQLAKARKLGHPDALRPAFSEEYIAKLTKVQEKDVELTSKLSKSDKRRGFKLIKDSCENKMVCKVYDHDGIINGIPRPKGTKKYTWEHMADTTNYTYDIGLIRKYKAALHGIIANNLPNPSRKLRLEENEAAEELYSSKL